jgi:hypothetical protein
VKLRDRLKKMKLRVSTQGEAQRLLDSKEKAWGTFGPSPQDDRPPH